MKIAVIIPARLGSSRFPGKPLEKIHDLPMIEHVRRRVLLAKNVSEVIVATCDSEIFDLVSSHHGNAVMTSNTHERCTERIEEAARNINADIIVNIQGDEPLVDPKAIEAVCKPLLENPNIQVTNVVHQVQDINELNSCHVVKCVLDIHGNILYFSRSPIPFPMVAKTKLKIYKQAGIMAFRKDFLTQFVTEMKPGTLEQSESVDMLRILEHGHKIRSVPWHGESVGVDLPEHIKKVEGIILNDPRHHKIYNTINR